MKNRTKKFVYIGMLSALSFIFYFLEISVGFLFPMTPFLKIDFSDVPAVIGTLGLGPVSGIVIEVIKNIFHICITKEPAFSGEIGNLLAGIGMILPLWFFEKKCSFKGKRFFGIFASAVIVVIIMTGVNYFITLPLYGIFETKVKIAMILTCFAPFNLIKTVVISIISLFLFDVIKRYRIF